MGKWSCFRPRSTMATAKLIHLDGELEEFRCPIRVSNLLPENLDVFICNADQMDVDEFLSAVDGDENLAPGKLYFELQLSWLPQKLRVEVMASLAVKASTALAASGGESFGCCFIRATRKVEPLILLEDDSEDEIRLFDRQTEVSAVVEGGGVVANAALHVACKRGKFTPRMSMIIEE